MLPSRDAALIEHTAGVNRNGNTFKYTDSCINNLSERILKEFLSPKGDKDTRPALDDESRLSWCTLTSPDKPLQVSAQPHLVSGRR